MDTEKRPRTLFQISGVPVAPTRWSNSTLIIIDAQEFYRTGTLQLSGINEAITQARRVLDAARTNSAPVIHVVQQPRAGSDVFRADSCRILAELAPKDGECVVTKAFPDSFHQTDLEEQIRASGRTELVMIGFMTHMCLSTSVRTAVHRGFKCTVVANACATRDLPDDRGGVVTADAMHSAELAALADRFACVVARADEIPD